MFLTTQYLGEEKHERNKSEALTAIETEEVNATLLQKKGRKMNWFGTGFELVLI